MVLGDAFPSELKAQHAVDNLAPGSIVKLHTDIPNPAKEKFFVIGYEEDGLRAFIVNSEINAFTQSRPHLLNAQVEISKAEHPDVLDHDSFIDCSKLVFLSAADVVSQVCTELGRLHGPCSDGVKQSIVQAVNDSVMYSDVEKARLKTALT